MHVFLERWLHFSELWGVCPHQRQWDPLVGGWEKGCQPRRDFIGLLRAPCLGLQLQDGPRCQPAAGSARILLA